MGGGLESRCVGRVYVADGAVRLPSVIQEKSRRLLMMYVLMSETC